FEEDIEPAVAVEIGQGDFAETGARKINHDRGGKGAVAVVSKDGEFRYTNRIVADQQIRLSVTVEVTGGDAARARQIAECLGRRKRPVTYAEKKSDVARVPVRCRKIPMTIAIKIRGHKRTGRATTAWNERDW